ncbi:MAG: hypothetical protein JSV09_05485 [Thermoplasmata archaeon]|nr:MAG: hypothetical protein JSV09_05485 [Thermoplasmata archaeon]
MRNKIVLNFAILIIICLLLVLSLSAQATTVTVGPDTANVETHELDSGEDIIWEWEVVNDRNIDFWIVDEQGTKYIEVYNATSSRGSFEVPTGGSWSVVFYNDDFYSVVIDYTITIDSFGGSIVFLTVLITILLVVIILLVLMLKKKQAQSK